ncbi:GNAT family N-acetyltransferase [Pseudalkalibacillus caeni]|uniref:GNAT family N-acetyltransferase n=1 Tax=Exobacillus caeni TaxID=2574798 RepID=A0A5R9F4H9_9BACL|nr:GNAT family N-acetyltransferase [Pseudalkalibacillus caeni]TLS37266.1 GNAT family N-acetyltransferase [Pseudalkalibacillus caeni]
MIKELDKKDFYKCLSLLQGNPSIEARAVIEGNNPGRVFVDDPKNPGTGLIWFHSNDLGFAFIGDPENGPFNDSLNDFVDNYLVGEMKRRGLNGMYAAVYHHEWERTLSALFQDNEGFGIDNQRVYKFDEQNNLPPSPVFDSRYEIVKLTKQMLEKGKLKNGAFLQKKIQEFWITTEDFFQEGVGFAAIHNNEVASLCFSAFVAGNTHTVDIETLEGHRGNGLAGMLAYEFVKKCREQKITVYWDCMEINEPSNAVAKKTGLTKRFEYRVVYFNF